MTLRFHSALSVSAKNLIFMGWRQKVCWAMPLFMPMTNVLQTVKVYPYTRALLMYGNALLHAEACTLVFFFASVVALKLTTMRTLSAIFWLSVNWSMNKRLADKSAKNSIAGGRVDPILPGGGVAETEIHHDFLALIIKFFNIFPFLITLNFLTRKNH